ncbi:MAG: hypothetical protein ACREN7_04010 [Candidatus Dormibacteria bacterium]
MTPVSYPPGGSPTNSDLYNSLLNSINGMAAISGDDIWAVGGYDAYPSPGGAEDLSGTLAEHWDGSKWSVIPVPDPADTVALGGDVLAAVTAFAADDVWAVGFVGVPGGAYDNGQLQLLPVDTLIEHWNGSSWSIIPSPDVAARNGEPPWDLLTAISGTGPDDIWAVGTTEWDVLDNTHTLAPAEPLVEHWNGSVWSIVPASDPVPHYPSSKLGSQAVISSGGSPAAFGDATLMGVTAISPSDAWAVGQYSPNDGTIPSETLTEHWNGSTWSTVAAPDRTLPEPLSNGSTKANDVLTAVAAAPDGTLWSVGEAAPASGIVLERDRSLWRLERAPSLTPAPFAVQPPPGPLPYASPLYSVLAPSVSSVWILGSAILHWDGSSWRADYTAGGSDFGTLFAAAALTSDDFWAAGPSDFVHHACGTAVSKKRTGP